MKNFIEEYGVTILSALFVLALISFPIIASIILFNILKQSMQLIPAILASLVLAYVMMVIASSLLTYLSKKIQAKTNEIDERFMNIENEAKRFIK